MRRAEEAVRGRGPVGEESAVAARLVIVSSVTGLTSIIPVSPPDDGSSDSLKRV